MVNLIGYLLLLLGTVLVQVKSEPQPSPFFIPKSESGVKPSYGPPAPSYGPPAPSYGPPAKPSYQLLYGCCCACIQRGLKHCGLSALGLVS